eukprot:73804-Pleurochrysis_carterae.AAC.1
MPADPHNSQDSQTKSLGPYVLCPMTRCLLNYRSTVVTRISRTICMHHIWLLIGSITRLTPAHSGSKGNSIAIRNKPARDRMRSVLRQAANLEPGITGKVAATKLLTRILDHTTMRRPTTPRAAPQPERLRALCVDCADRGSFTISRCALCIRRLRVTGTIGHRRKCGGFTRRTRRRRLSAVSPSETKALVSAHKVTTMFAQLSGNRAQLPSVLHLRPGQCGSGAPCRASGEDTSKSKSFECCAERAPAAKAEGVRTRLAVVPILCHARYPWLWRVVRGHGVLRPNPSDSARGHGDSRGQQGTSVLTG